MLVLPSTAVLLALLLFSMIEPYSRAFVVESGYWYDNTRPPQSQYTTLPYANLTVRIAKPYQEGPGKNLIIDPFDFSSELFTGNTIARQSFDTQFILDLNYATGLDVNRLLVLNVQKGLVHFSWESTSVIVNFAVLERNQTGLNTLSGQSLLEFIASLTNYVQLPDSLLYHGTNVTKYIDSNYGVQVDGWDISLELTYSIEVVGKDAVIDGSYLNFGARGTCESEVASNFSTYCEFERFFEDDVSRSLGIMYYRVQVMFIKKASLDSVYVYFRISPPDVERSKQLGQPPERNISSSIELLVQKVQDFQSDLYDGNVTIRVNPQWGVAGRYPKKRTQEARFSKKWYDFDVSRLSDPRRKVFVSPYIRCQQNHRCNWGQYQLDQYTNDVKYFQRLFDRGNMYGTNLFLDFQDWRLGSRGFSWKGQIPPTAKGRTTIPMARAKDGIIRGAHLWPFDQDSLGPDVPCYLYERNQGLVLDRVLQRKQIDEQESLVTDLDGRIDWLGDNIEWATMGPELRSRKDVRRELEWVKDDFRNWKVNEVGELRLLNSSMCAQVECWLLFNTSSLELTGAISGTGVIRFTDAGTEVAVFSFNSVVLGPEVKVTIVGQRAISIVSKTSAVINTTIVAEPGTIGGMRGGGSVGRFEADRLTDHPRSIFICDIGLYCEGDTVTNRMKAGSMAHDSFISNNVNGPGSGNLRVHPFVITTTADDIREIQVIHTAATPGQTLAGGFKLHFRGYNTPIIPHDVSADMLKAIVENNLNIVPPSNAPYNTDRITSTVAGVGTVDVSRSRQDEQEGYTWSLTFTTYIGNMEQITLTDYLEGLGAAVSISTFRNGNELGGTFKLSFQGENTAPISIYETAAHLKKKLLGLSTVSTAFVTRIDPTQNCDDGLCNNGPLPARGMVWTCFVTTDLNNDNITPLSPTSPLTRVEGDYFRMVAHGESMTGSGATVNVTYGTSISPNQMMSALTITSPFSLAYGGAGASYGGLGGKGYSETPTGPIYNDDKITDLLGGSGGAMRGINVFDVNLVKGQPTGLGGHGGGAIEIIAANDVVIGPYGRLRADGQDAEQSSEGGGGGGSGGAILLAAGGTVVNEGYISARGGKGGFGGFDHPDKVGGGGSGGRVAMFGESVTVMKTAKVDVSGGACGAFREWESVNVLAVNVSMHFEMLTPLDDLQVVSLGRRIIADTLQPLRPLEDISYLTSMVGSVLHAQVKVGAFVEHKNRPNFTAADIDILQAKLNATVGMNLAEVYLLSNKIYSERVAVWTSLTTKFPFNCKNSGSAGSFMTETLMTTSMYVAETNGAEGTNKALFFSNNENTNTTSGSFREAPFPWNGPIVAFEASRPTRITYYTRLASMEGESTKANFGALFSLLSRGEAGLDTSNVIGIFLGNKIMHGANFGTAVDEKAFLKRMVTIGDYPSFNKWYKIGIFIQWDLQTYYVTIDDTVMAKDQPFKADDIDGIRLSLMRATQVWYDEIYVGFDNTMGFMCPTTSRDKGTQTMSPPQRHWSLEELVGAGSSGFTEYKRMSRHYSHVDPTGQSLFDGKGLVTKNQDIKFKYPSGDYPVNQGQLHAGAMNYITNSLRSPKSSSGRSSTTVSPSGLWYAPKDGPGGAGDGRQYWYTEYNYVDLFTETMNGGIMACSSQDLLTWRFEGIIFHYTNVSDMVYGSPGPFAIERPKVRWNPHTSEYVMWGVMDNVNRTLAMAFVASSPFEDGPFMFKRSFYPDGNQTRDQVVFINEENVPVLARTYYQTVEFVQADAVMQPVWEAVKDKNGSTYYRASYLRGAYDVGYDNFHDIFYQRWRLEDKPYKVQCINRLDPTQVRDVPAGTFVEDTGAACYDPEEYKSVLGQGNPPVSTNFFTPNSSENSWWIQTSVPSVKAQPWASSYRDGYCGIRVLDDNMDLTDPNLNTMEVQDRSTCSNIRDNPPHESMEDKLIGAQNIVQTRRAKFMAVSELTLDLMDTTGALNSFEGELDSGDLISMIIEMGQFGFGAGAEVKSTFRPPIRSEFNTAADYKTRFYQYINHYNDRATYSLACVLDGTCPVNFKDQLTKGNK